MADVVDLEKEVVLTEDLAPLIAPLYRRRIENWRREWPNEIGKNSVNRKNTPDPNVARSVSATGAGERISFESGISPRGINRILNQESIFVDLAVADRLLMAFDLTIHHVPVYKAYEVRKAIKEQGEILRTICRASGKYVPENGKAETNQTARIPNLRKQLQAAV